MPNMLLNIIIMATYYYIAKNYIIKNNCIIMTKFTIEKHDENKALNGESYYTEIVKLNWPSNT